MRLSREKKLDQPLSALNLGGRAHSALCWWVEGRKGLALRPATEWDVRVRDVASMTEADFKDCGNFGKASIIEFRNKLDNYLGNATPLVVGDRVKDVAGRKAKVVFVGNGKACVAFKNGDIEIYPFIRLVRL